MDTALFNIIPILIPALFVGAIITIFYLAYKWITFSLSLKREQNEILREILEKMNKK
jgi:hypothetical protein